MLELTLEDRIEWLKENSSDYHLYEELLYGHTPIYIKTLEKLEDAFIKSSEIAMAYNKKLNTIITPFHKSITNLMNIFGFSFAKICRIKDVNLEVYVDDSGNEAWITYRIGRLIIKADLPDSIGKIRIPTFTFYVDPEIAVSYKSGRRPRIINLKTFVELFRDNRIAETSAKYVKLYLKSLKNLVYIT